VPPPQQGPLIARVVGDSYKTQVTGQAARLGFTLAEVLITLGIIGVVAALTIPTLIEKHQKHVTINGLKKTYSELSNIIRMSESYNGEMSQWDFPQKEGKSDDAVEFLNKYYAPYAQGAKVYSGTEMNKRGYYFYNLGQNHKFTGHTAMILSNGTIIALYPNIKNGYIWLFADINGFKKPNKVGRDVFVFDAYHFADWNIKNYRLRFWGATWNRNTLSKNPEIPEEEQEVNYSYYECNKENKYGLYSGWYCGALIEKDGWKIAPDYPW